jgi:hypothetical protein
MVGNWYCVPSSCGRVVYREYLPPVVRWRYPGEAWQEIEGDDYNIEDNTPFFPQTTPKAYRIWAKGKIKTRVPPPPDTNPPQPIRYQAGQEVLCTILTWIQAPVWSVTPIFTPNSSIRWRIVHTPTVDGNQFFGNCEKRTVEFPVFIPKANGTADQLSTEANTNGPSVGFFYDWWLVEDPSVTVRRCVNQQNFTCIFKIFKNGNIVHQETRSICPEVEQLPCKLSDTTKQIEIKKIPYLEKIEVVNYQYSAFKQPGLSFAPIPIPQADPIPQECLNIYNNAIFVIPPDPNALKNPDATPFDTLIRQICSAPGCPPPEYQVICDCNCESCPPDTCPVECGDHICCYDDDGIAVKSIPIDNYCGD